MQNINEDQLKLDYDVAKTLLFSMLALTVTIALAVNKWTELKLIEQYAFYFVLVLLIFCTAFFISKYNNLDKFYKEKDISKKRGKTISARY